MQITEKICIESSGSNEEARLQMEENVSFWKL